MVIYTIFIYVISNIQEKDICHNQNNEFGTYSIFHSRDAPKSRMVGQTTLSRSLPRTLFHGDTARGSGGSNGAYDDSTVVGESTTGENLNDAEIMKASTMSTAGMIVTKYRWIRRPAPYISVSKADNTYTNTQEAYIRHIKTNNNQCVADLIAISTSVADCILCNNTEIKRHFKKSYTEIVKTLYQNQITKQNPCGILDKFSWDSITINQRIPTVITSVTTAEPAYTGNRYFNTVGGNLAADDGIVYSTASKYNIVSFGTIAVTYSIILEIYEPIDISVLAVAGGGGGGVSTGGGGGGGGMVQQLVSLPVGTNTITITVGDGGKFNTNGQNTTVFFDLVPESNITAIGGGHCADWYYINPGNGGSGGGGAENTDGPPYTYHIGGTGIPGQGNAGGNALYSSTGDANKHGAGGGGAGTAGLDYNVTRTIGGINYFGSGGYGLQCTLPGISTIYSTQYWAGGGGGTTSLQTNSDAYTKLTNAGGAGGIGGGGGGGFLLASYDFALPGVIEDTYETAINPGTTCVPNPISFVSNKYITTNQCQGGRNTGGGGGSCGTSYYQLPVDSVASKGGSGIVAIAFM